MGDPVGRVKCDTVKVYDRNKKKCLINLARKVPPDAQQ